MKTLLAAILTIAFVVASERAVLADPSLADYTAYPPFVSQAVPPLVMLVMSKDQRLFYKAYNDIMDLDKDGTIDTTYKDTINYYGYFDSNKCYVYQNSRFEPSATATGTNLHACSAKWSGNFLNWATMARIDVVRKTLYGGYRSSDTAGTDASGGGATTVLSRTVLPRDNHSWVKTYNGSDLASFVPTSALGIASGSVTLCNTNTASTETTGLMMVVDGNYPYAASTEVYQCQKTFEGSGSTSFSGSTILKATYNVDVKVCDPSLLESNCFKYTDDKGTASTSDDTITYKPTGLIQRQGINTQGTSATADDTILIKFALITGSYGANFSGGVLRSNITDVNSEINVANGTIASGSKIIKNIDKFRILGYKYSSGYSLSGAEGTCSSTAPADGDCKSWGNPIGEMLYEAIRYFKGVSGPTTQFKATTPDYTGATLTVESTWTDPYSTCPYCSKPFVLLFSDTYPSFDSNQLPGSYWPTTISSSDTPSVQTLIDNSGINTLEGISSVLVGESAGTADKACTSKTGNFKSIRGLCVEEPTKQGAYYTAGLAHYANTTDLRTNQTGDQKITTYSVATNSPIPVLEFTVAGKKLQMAPIFRDGCPLTSGLSGCTTIGQYGDGTKGQLADFKYCDGDTDWTTEQGNGFTSCYDILWDDAEFGNDYDLDIRYRIYVKPGTTTVDIKTKGIYAAAGHTDFGGYFITGVSAPGEYWDLRCGGSLAGSTDCDRATDGNETATNTRTFTVTGTSTGFLKDPLWYAAKYGGFQDKDGDNQPNLASEWDKDGDGVPDTYFYAANPLQLEANLAAAFAAILNRAASGTAASVLASSTTGDGALYQSYFFPTQFEGERQVKWTGYTQGLFVDEFGNLREDTNGDGRLVYTQDNIIITRYDTVSSSVKVDRYADTDGNGVADSATPTTTVSLSEITPIWEAGKQLALTASTSRKIFTWLDDRTSATPLGAVDAGEQISFDSTNATILSPFLRAGSSPYTATNIINFIRGDQISGLRDRQLTVNGSLNVWKLGDPVYSTPVIVGPPKERYDVIYGDSSYTAFFQKYKSRRQVAYVGANDGMLHAFNVGFYHRGDDTSTGSAVEHGYFTTNATNNSSGVALGSELWGFIPYELLPQLLWLTQTGQNGYTHVYYVDLKPKVTDARIFADDATHPGGWGTLLIVGMRLGGSCGACAAGNGAPMTVSTDFGSGATTTRTFYSAYFALDITDPEQDPVLLWSFSQSDLGLTMSYPTIVRTKPACTGDNCKIDNSDAKWFMVVGSGPTSYAASSSQTAKIYAVDLKAGPIDKSTGASLVGSFTTGDANSFVGDVIALDVQLDYRADVTYMGTTIATGSTNPTWNGKLYRLTTNGGAVSPGTWGVVSGSSRSPTLLLGTFPSNGSLSVGPVTAAPTVAEDDAHNIWVYFGTGRYFSSTGTPNDKSNTDTQYFFGVKDPVVTGGCTETSVTNCERKDLVNVSSTTVCIACGSGNQVTDPNNTAVTSFSGDSTTTLQGLVQSKNGWYTTLPGSGERDVSTPVIVGGTVFFPTFTPSSDACVSSGTGTLYALFYQTGSAYKASIVGTEVVSGKTNVKRSTDLGTGLASQMAIHIGAQGSGSAGSSGASGSSGRVSVLGQSSTGAVTKVSASPALSSWSRVISWINQRD